LTASTVSGRDAMGGDPRAAEADPARAADTIGLLEAVGRKGRCAADRRLKVGRLGLCEQKSA